MKTIIYYIYEIIGVKIGCTKQELLVRFKQNVKAYARKGIDISDKEIVLLETHTIKAEASRREKILQAEKGYPVDINNYMLTTKNSRTVCQTPQAIKKRVSKFKEQHKAKGWGKELIKVYKASVIREGSFWITYRGDYIDTIQGIDNVRERFNIKHRSGIGNVLNNRGGAKSYQGYIFEYA